MYRMLEYIESMKYVCISMKTNNHWVLRDMYHIFFMKYKNMYFDVYES